ncbi:hypothetical protein PAENIP36_07430 [Paenibacillus sp. P36]
MDSIIAEKRHYFGHSMTWGRSFSFLDWRGMDIKGFLDKTIDIDYQYQYNKASE